MHLLPWWIIISYIEYCYIKPVDLLARFCYCGFCRKCCFFYLHSVLLLTLSRGETIDLYLSQKKRNKIKEKLCNISISAFWVLEFMSHNLKCIKQLAICRGGRYLHFSEDWYSCWFKHSLVFKMLPMQDLISVLLQCLCHSCKIAYD